MGRTDRRTDTHRETAGEVTLDRTLAPSTCCRPTPAHETESDPAPEKRAEGRLPWEIGGRGAGAWGAVGGQLHHRLPGARRSPAWPGGGQWTLKSLLAAHEGARPLHCPAGPPSPWRHPRQTGPKVPRGCGFSTGSFVDQASLASSGCLPHPVTTQRQEGEVCSWALASRRAPGAGEQIMEGKRPPAPRPGSTPTPRTRPRTKRPPPRGAE